MGALLVLRNAGSTLYYMIKELAFTQGHASQIYGLYTGLVYLTPLFGGILADRKLGQRKTVILGAVLMALGHFMMAFEFLFFPALLLLILGNGAFKPNISTRVGSLYPPGDPRRAGIQHILCRHQFGRFFFAVDLRNFR